MRTIARMFVAALAAAAAIHASAPSANAQGMVPARGSGSVTVGYQTGLITEHLLVDRAVGGVRINTHALLVDFSVGLGRSFGLGVALPLVAARYNGRAPHVPSAEELLLHPDFTLIDDGRYHTAFQDFRVELRYAFDRGGLHLMPFVTAVLPSHNYEFLGHAAVGRRVNELRTGVALHRLLTPWSARSYVQAHAAFAFQEGFGGVSRNATHLNLEGGYFLRPNLTVFGGAIFHTTHGGIDLHGDPRVEFSGPYFLNHDRIARERMFSLGGGASYSLSDAYSVGGTISRTVKGINGHFQAFVFTLLVSRSFGGPHSHN